MAYLMLASCLSFLLVSKMVSAQKLPSSDRLNKSFVSARAGEDLTIQCLYDNAIPGKIYWYKQILGQRPKLILTFHTENKNSSLEEIKDYPRFKMDHQYGKALLTISDLNTSDSALYHCIFYSYLTPTFAESVTVSVKGFGSDATLIRQPGSEMIRPPGSVTLDCTVHTGSCDGEHHVYWYKESEESLPVLFHTHGGRNDQCDTQNNTCFYQLPMDNLTQADAGMYYCAVAACGQVLFGNGTVVDTKDDADYFWKVAFGVASSLSLFLAFSILMISKCCQSAESVHGISSRDVKGYPGRLYFAALSVNLSNSSRMKDPTWSACVYYSVKQSN
ncbi:unnamed protein product [Ophioblennius macclurei]